MKLLVRLLVKSFRNVNNTASGLERIVEFFLIENFIFYMFFLTLNCKDNLFA